MRGLIIRSPWIGYILEGRKTWEIRSKATTVRERIVLIKGGSGTIVGTAQLVNVVGPMTLAELNRHIDKHCAPPELLGEFVGKYGGKAYAWVLENVQALAQPVPYKHPSGAVIWVTLDDQILSRQGVEGAAQ